MSLDHILSLLGLVIGACGGGFGFWWGRRQAARKRGLDERYKMITAKSLATSWIITLISIFIFFILLNIGIRLTAAPILGILLIIHMAGWTFSTLYYNLKL